MTEEAQAPADGYEFSADENRTIGRTGSRARWWGILMIAFAALFAGLGVFVVVEEGFDASGVVIWTLIAFLPFYIGGHFLRAGRSLRTVVMTEGNDVAHLMDALGSLGSALTVQLAAMTAWFLLVVLGVAFSISSMGHTRDRAYIAAQKSDLRNLASVQEIYFADSGEDGGDYTYAPDYAALDFVTSEGVTITLLSSGADGWSARSSHAALAGVECVIAFGDVPMPSTSRGVTPSQPGEIICDE